MKTVEMCFEEYIKYGFTKHETPCGIYYTAPASLGDGGFTIIGDVSSCYASLGDIVLKKDIVTLESVNEHFLTFGDYIMGDASFYKVRNDSSLYDHGMNVYTNLPAFVGYTRMKAQQRLVCNGLIMREKFFSELQFDIPADFWESAAEVLNPNMVNIPQLFQICEQIKTCRLTGMELNMYIRAKGLESLSFILDYIYKHKQKAVVRLSSADRTALKEAQEILHKDIKNPPSIKALAGLIGVNQQKLMTGFKQITGTSVYGYLRRIRMEKASELLRDTELTVSQIAKEVGYHGDGHFQKAFALLFGTAPGKFRQELRMDMLL